MPGCILFFIPGGDDNSNNNDENENHGVPVVAETRFKAHYDDDHLYIGRRVPRHWEKEEK